MEIKIVSKRNNRDGACQDGRREETCIMKKIQDEQTLITNQGVDRLRLTGLVVMLRGWLPGATTVGRQTRKGTNGKRITMAKGNFGVKN